MESALCEHPPQMLGQVRPERLFARHQGQTPSKTLSHKLSSLTHLVFVRLSRKVLCHKLTHGDARDSHGAFDDGEDDLHVKSMSTKTNETEEHCNIPLSRPSPPQPAPPSSLPDSHYTVRSEH